jgi:hypothetical protein
MRTLRIIGIIVAWLITSLAFGALIDLALTWWLLHAAPIM